MTGKHFDEGGACSKDFVCDQMTTNGKTVTRKASVLPDHFFLAKKRFKSHTCKREDDCPICKEWINKR